MNPLPIRIGYALAKPIAKQILNTDDFYLDNLCWTYDPRTHRVTFSFSTWASEPAGSVVQSSGGNLEED